MNPDQPDPDSRILVPPALLEAYLEPLLAEPFVQAWARAPQEVTGRLGVQCPDSCWACSSLLRRRSMGVT